MDIGCINYCYAKLHNLVYQMSTFRFHKFLVAKLLVLNFLVTKFFVAKLFVANFLVAIFLFATIFVAKSLVTKNLGQFLSYSAPLRPYHSGKFGIEINLSNGVWWLLTHQNIFFFKSLSIKILLKKRISLSRRKTVVFWERNHKGDLKLTS